jgi:regulator of sigma E protease
MSNFLTAFVSVAIVLGIMIFVHEWGHFIAAKLSGVRVDVFSFGFGTRLFGVKRGDTDYRLSALPFGGYVRMAGDNPVEERSGAPYEFLSKSRWIRVVIAVAGPAMNVLLAFVLFWGIFWLVGVPVSEYLSQPAEVAAVPQNPPVISGVQPGDQIQEINGVATPTWKAVSSRLGELKPGEPMTMVVLRNGESKTLSLAAPEESATYQVVGYPMMAPVVDETAIGMPAEKAGIKSGDLIVAMNGKPVTTWPQLVDAVHNSNGHAIEFRIRRDGQEISLSITPMQGMDPDGQTVWQIGVTPRTKDEYQRQDFITSAKDASFATVSGLRQIGDVLAGLFTGKVSIRQLAGPVGIARMSGQAAREGPVRLLELMAIISLNLGLLNLLPIPILDGGHVLLLAIEGLRRRDLSIAFKERFVQVGLVFLLGIFAFVMYSDILKLIQSHTH